MAESNGSKTAKIISVIISIALILIMFGTIYGTLITRVNAVEIKTVQIDERSQRNKDILISLQRDIEYIKRAVDELRGKR